ncbi:Transcriptional regulatory protein YycF [Bacteroidales bacterium Barb7]|nr:Transcriptional regulatory protein YycF [Bacteroidales bacterium Barb7]
MTKHKILIVDDEPDICEILAYNLTNEGYETTCVRSAEEALKALVAEYSLILLDVMLGGMSGYQLAETLRRKGNQIPVVFLTAKDTENDMLTGFSVGGDDYIPKPFSLKEVSARVKAILKRQKTPDGKFIFNDVMIDFELKEMAVGSIKVGLTKTEFEIISLLANNQNHVFSREEIIDNVWKDTPYITERTVDVHITRLRKKLGSHASLISNRPGFGYLFNALDK